MYKSIILPLAKENIKEAAHWYNDKKNGLGKRFTKEVRSKIGYVRKNPKAVAIRYEKIRCAVLDVFPFMVHYTLNEKQKTVIVTAVFHTSLSPEQWKKR